MTDLSLQLIKNSDWQIYKVLLLLEFSYKELSFLNLVEASFIFDAVMKKNKKEAYFLLFSSFILS